MKDKTTKNKFHKIPEVASLLGVSRYTIYRLIKAGDLVLIKIGKCARVTDESLQAFIKRQQAA